MKNFKRIEKEYEDFRNGVLSLYKRKPLALRVVPKSREAMRIQKNLL